MKQRQAITGAGSPPTDSDAAVSRAVPPQRSRRGVLAGVGIGVLGTAAALAGLTYALDAPPGAERSAIFEEAPPAPAPPVRPSWTIADARDLLAAVDGSRAEGLRPADYGRDRLTSAIAAGATGPELDRVAAASALALAADYARGRVTNRAGMDWHIVQPPHDSADLPGQLAQAVADRGVGPWLDGLLPQDPRYAALREALRSTPPEDGAARDRLRANMERWRWMPRALGDSYLYVNVPSYRLAVIENGAQAAGYDVVVGAPATPTPQLAAPAHSLVVNPFWYVPASIVRSSGLRAGRRYQAIRGGGLRQSPGPGNALGKIKINITNDHAIYLHDTPSKWAFARTDRALSHGCIRVKNIDELAARLIQGDGEPFRKAYAQGGTRTIDMGRSWPVYLVYFTEDLGEDGQLVRYGDPYGRDRKLIAALDGSGAAKPGLDGRLALASR